uniref:Putative secreted protein n=1 Tax=Ixodes ricinus TaxID=34613 RepID=A0A6B0U926_IXORI
MGGDSGRAVLIVLASAPSTLTRPCLLSPVTSAKPFTLSVSAVLSSADSWSCDTFTSPLYMNSTMALRSM